MTADTLSNRRKSLLDTFNEVDLTFLVLRLTTILGGIAWLLLAPLSGDEITLLRYALVFFSCASLVFYSLILWQPGQRKYVYLLSLVFDLLFIYFFVSFHLPANNSFFLGYYLLAALHTFYFGLRFGVLVATLAAILLFTNMQGDFHWTDMTLRIAFLYCLAIPLGLLAEKMKKDSKHLEELNRQLVESIANIRAMQEKLIEAEKLSALGRLTADIAHEIRNPLSALGGFARRLDKLLPGDGKEKQYMGVIISEVDRLEKILSDTLIYSRFNGIRLQRGQLSEPLDEATAVYCDTCCEQAIELKLDITPGLPDIYLDKDQIRQAVGNLIVNARDAMSGGGELTVSLGQEEISGVPCQIVRIRDTGPGIPDDKQALIFEPFYSTKKIGKGTGLGLAIVQKIMEEHRGFIQVSSNRENGTVFSLVFPYQSAEEGGRIPCWEFMHCGIEQDTSRRCPAYPYFGRICWAIAGTYCAGKVAGIFAEKIDSCQACPYYLSVQEEKTPADPG